jgi:hypothetical protein
VSVRNSVRKPINSATARGTRCGVVTSDRGVMFFISALRLPSFSMTTPTQLDGTSTTSLLIRLLELARGVLMENGLGTGHLELVPLAAHGLDEDTKCNSPRPRRNTRRDSRSP